FDFAIAQRTSESGGNDIAFFLINGEIHVLGEINSVNLSINGTDTFRFTEYSTFDDLPELEAGIHTIAFGIVNIGTGSGRTALLLDSIQLSVIDTDID